MRRRLIFMLGILLLLATPAQPLFPVLFGAICLLGALLIANVLAKSLCIPLPASRRAGPRSIGGRLGQYGLAGSLLALFAVGGYGVAMHLVHAEHVGAADQPSGPGGVLGLAGGEGHSLAIRGDGTVAGWGNNVAGQLGDGTTVSRSGAAPVSRLPGGVTAIAGGSRFSLALTADGTAWSWGANYQGQLGDGTTTESRTTPVHVSGLTGVTSIAAGHDHGLATRSDGTIWTWGSNASGQLGDGTTINRAAPVQVGLFGVIAVAGRGYHSLALKGDGTVWAWGYNASGQLGDGTTTQRTTPVQVTGLTDAIAIAAGQSFSLALKSDGTVWAWGRNDVGQTGTPVDLNGGCTLDGQSDPCRRSPVRVGGLSGVTAIAAGGNHSLALKSDGTVWAWGRNDNGELGVPRTATCSPYWYIDGPVKCSSTPVQVNSATGLDTAVAIAAGSSYSLALKGDGTAWAWGGGGWQTTSETCPYDGRNNACSTTPINVKFLPAVSRVTAFGVGGSHTLARKGDEPIWTWGVNASGQLGDGSAVNRPIPAPSGGTFGLTTVTGGGNHSLALTSEGTVSAWGLNSSGQLGNGTTTNRLSPVQLSSLSDVTAIAAGGSHSLALKSDGTVWAWGSNQYGQLGDGTTTQRLAPVQVSGLTEVTAIAAGGSHSLGLKSDGTVWAWGLNANGQLGNRSSKNSSSPVQVRNLTRVARVAAGSNHSLATGGDGTWAWGANTSGQLGTGDTRDSNIPVEVKDASGTTTLGGMPSIAAGGNHSLARTAFGTVWAWGNNAAGQLGDGTVTQRNLPVQVSNFSGAKVLAAGENHNVALKDDGTLWAWGKNDVGQLGDCSTTNRTSPVKVCGLDGMTGTYEALHNTQHSVSWTFNEADPVNVVFGAFLYDQQDLALPGRGIPIVLARSYNSLDKINQGFGTGWSFSFLVTATQISRKPETVEIRHGDGRNDRFTANSAGQYIAPPGIFDRLTKNPNGTYTLTTPKQVAYAFNSGGRLESIKDRHGNETKLAHDNTGFTITDPGNRQVQFFYGAPGTPDQYRYVLAKEVNGLNRTVGYKYDPNTGDLLEVTDVRGKVTKYTYDLENRLTKVVDPLGKTVVYNEYDGQGKVRLQRDGEGVAAGCNPCATDIMFDYTTSNQTTFKDRRGKLWTYTYDAVKRVTSEKNPLGQTTVYGYDSNNNRTTVQDRRGKTWVYEYDTANPQPESRGNLLSVKDPLNHVTRYTYTARNDLKTITVPVSADESRPTTFNYGPNDQGNSLTSVVDPAGETIFTPLPNGDLDGVRDASGVVTRFGYDKYGNRNRVFKNPNGTELAWQLEYDAGSRLKKRADPLGHTTEYDYTEANQPKLIRVTPEAGVVLETTMDYDPAGNLLWLKDANGHTTSFTLYDANNNLKRAVDWRGHAVEYGYDANYNRETVKDASDPLGRTVTYGYDDANRLTWVRDHGGNRVDYTLDGEGNVTEVLDPNRNPTRYEYDEAGRLCWSYPGASTASCAAPPAGATVYEYNWADQLTKVTDANGHNTTYKYDPAGRPNERIDHLGRRWSAVYDANGRVKSRTDPEALTTTYKYDGANRLCWSAPGTPTAACDAPPAGAVSYGYDDADRRVSMTDATGQTTYGYDDADRLVRVTAPLTGTVQYRYDGIGQVTRLTYPLGRVVAIDYTVADKITVSDGQAPAGLTTYGYDPAGRLTSIVSPNGVVSSYGYDPAGRLNAITHAKGGVTLASVEYPDIDANGNRKTVVETGVPNAGTTTYTYDTLNRLKTASHSLGGAASWQFDAVGNRTAQTVDGVTTTYAYNELNQLCWAAPGSPTAACAAVPAGATTYGYDLNGNRTSKVEGGSTTVYDYDREDRLVGVTAGGAAMASYRYDGDGYRVSTTAGGVTTAAAWDRLGLGTVIAEGGQEYVHGPAGLQQRVAAGVAQYAHGDGLGSVRLATDSAGGQVGAATYEPWGAPKPGSAALGGFGYTGEQADGETGFVYLRARHYDPATGRFVQRDPAGLAGSGTNLYAYAGNNPANLVDPSGQVAWAGALPFVGAAVGLPAVATGAIFVGSAVLVGFAIGYALDHTLGQPVGEGDAGQTLGSPAYVGDAGQPLAGPRAHEGPGATLAGPQAFAGFDPTLAGPQPYSGDMGLLLAKHYDYERTFYLAYPQYIERLRAVHHAVPQDVLNLYPGRYTEEEMHALANLRGIPRGDHRLHGTLNREWNKFYRFFPDATRAEIERWRDKMDKRYGNRFLPPLE